MSNIHPQLNITAQEFFTQYFPNTYICAMADSGGQFEGRVPPPHGWSNVLPLYQDLNKSGYNIFFTPNGAKAVEGRNSLSNIKQINAWWIDIDIEETKKVDNEVQRVLRSEKKAFILGEIFGNTSLWPSLTIETRNGYQLYWFADDTATQEKWLSIGAAIYQHFKKVGADKSTVKIMQLMRVPKFYYFKHGERGPIEIFWPLSTFKKHSESEMTQHFPPTVVVETPALKIEVRTFRPTFKYPVTSQDVFVKATALPIEDVIQKLSGHWLVNGDTLTLQHENRDKSNILANGRVTPNWIVRSTNQIFSNNANRPGPTIIQYLEWYHGDRYALIAKGLKELFNIF